MVQYRPRYPSTEIPRAYGNSPGAGDAPYDGSIGMPELVSEGRLGLFSERETGFTPRILSWATFAAPPAGMVKSRPNTFMTEHFRGRLEVFGLADLLQWMELNRRSGRLTVTRGHDRRTLDWKEGEIVYVSGSLPRHRLGVHLLRSGSLPAATLYELLARNMTTQENLTRLILDMNHDTLDGLSLRVEELARKLLFEIFEWREANFEYDPSYRVQPILRIGLTLRGQALAFQGVKQLDDTHRLSRKARRENWEAADAWVLPFSPDGVEEHFWEATERMGSTLDPVETRGHATRFREFARRLRD